MASSSDAHTPQSQKAAFSPCEGRGAGLVLTLCPPWLLWKRPRFYGPLEFIRECSAFSRFLIPSPDLNGASKALYCLYNKDPHHLNSYHHHHFLHQKLGRVSGWKVRAFWKDMLKMNEWRERRSISMNGADVVETLMWSELQRHSDSPA